MVGARLIFSYHREPRLSSRGEHAHAHSRRKPAHALVESGRVVNRVMVIIQINLSSTHR